MADDSNKKRKARKDGGYAIQVSFNKYEACIVEWVDETYPHISFSNYVKYLIKKDIKAVSSDLPIAQQIAALDKLILSNQTSATNQASLTESEVKQFREMLKDLELMKNNAVSQPQQFQQQQQQVVKPIQEPMVKQVVEQPPKQVVEQTHKVTQEMTTPSPVTPTPPTTPSLPKNETNKKNDNRMDSAGIFSLMGGLPSGK